MRQPNHARPESDCSARRRPHANASAARTAVAVALAGLVCAALLTGCAGRSKPSVEPLRVANRLSGREIYSWHIVKRKR